VLTYKYAAPEQMKHGIWVGLVKLVEDRFGTLPAERMNWGIDQRTDIFSLGVIFHEVITGSIPMIANEGEICRRAIPEVAGIIKRCIQINPSSRYQSTAELMEDIQKVKAAEQRVLRANTSRKFSAIAAGLLGLLSGGAFLGSSYFFNMEKLSELVLEPANITVSLQQRAEFAIEKFLPDGTEKLIDSDQIRWSIEDGSVAGISGNYVVGLNVGETQVSGLYKNKVVKLDVKVIEPEEMVDVSLRHRDGNVVRVFAGNGIPGENDEDDFLRASFVSPGSIAADSEGTFYVAEPNCIRRLSASGRMDTIAFDAAYLAPDLIRCNDLDLYVLTKKWESHEDGKEYCAIARISGEKLETVYYSQADDTDIVDFLISEGSLYLLEQSYFQFSVNLKKIDLASGDVEIVDSFDDGVRSMALYGDSLFLANPAKGVIQSYNMPLKKLSFFAGIEDEKGFIDGTAPRFYEPLKLAVDKDRLYVLDFNIIRRIEIVEGAPGITETVAGAVKNDLNPKVEDGEGKDAVFAHSENSEFAIYGDKIVISDPKNFILRYIDMSADQVE
jgi:hypothetical protein